MRNYMAIAADGRLISMLITNAEWPDGYDVDSADPQHPQAKVDRAFHFEHPDVVEIVPHDCACPLGEFCDCPHDAMRDKYFDSSVRDYQDKPGLTVKLDGTVVDLGTVTEDNPYEAPEGSVVVLRVEAAVPDGEPLDELLHSGPHMRPTPRNAMAARHTRRTPPAPPGGPGGGGGGPGGGRGGKPPHPAMGDQRGKNRPSQVPAFQGGVAEIELTVPVRGFTSAIGVKRSKLVRPFCVWIRGV